VVVERRGWEEMKLMKLTKGLVAKVDDEQYNLLSEFVWCAHKSKNQNGTIRYCAARNKCVGGKRRLVFMQNELLTGAGVVDHINGDPLDNRLINLRRVSTSANLANRRRRGFHDTDRNLMRRFRVRVHAGGKKVFDGYAASKMDARLLYACEFEKAYGFSPRAVGGKEYVEDGVSIRKKRWSVGKYRSSRYEYVTFNRRERKWRAQPYIRGERKQVGSFSTQDAAYSAVISYLKKEGTNGKAKKGQE